ncbi:hypothetical protein TNCV_4839881 [Trichonephila clavipes]|nr:hypothetical protein TNCV_4839881 [Trichonephila clavipes]
MVQNDVAKSPRVAEHSATLIFTRLRLASLKSANGSPSQWYWARTHDMPAMIRYLDHWATTAHPLYPKGVMIMTSVGRGFDSRCC